MWSIRVFNKRDIHNDKKIVVRTKNLRKSYKMVEFWMQKKVEIRYYLLDSQVSLGFRKFYILHTVCEMNICMIVENKLTLTCNEKKINIRIKILKG